jgi:hypothetical protein
MVKCNIRKTITQANIPQCLCFWRQAMEETGKKDFDYAEFAKGLKSIQSMPPCPGCLKGGGNPDGGPEGKLAHVPLVYGSRLAWRTALWP